jgi:ribosomal protein S18 acetylase RimI-like enzyme
LTFTLWGNINIKKREILVEEKKPEVISDYRIERAQAEDLQSMLALWRIIPGLGIGRGDEEEALKAFLAKNPSTCLVLRENERLIGTVLGGFDGRRGYLYHLAVHPDYQGRGYGKQLLQQVIQEFKILGTLKIHLFTFKDNPAAAKFYENQGWEQRQDIIVFSQDTGNNIN